MEKIKEVEVLDIEDASEFDINEYYPVEEIEIDEKEQSPTSSTKLEDVTSSIESKEEGVTKTTGKSKITYRIFH